MSLTYLSVCSGIEAASVAWGPLGWKPLAFAEVDAFPSSVLAHHYPDTPNFGDLNAFREWPHLTPDVLVGGTPCQSFSVAGLRQGLADPRGNLALTYLAVAERYRPRWVVWENVPGVLSSNGGRDFGAFIGALAELGYGWAYRILDAQFFGVPQRRRRVFVVGCAGNWRRAAAVLFERESLRGDPPPSREAREVAPTIPSRRTGGGGEPAAAGRPGTDFDLDGGLIKWPADVASTLNAHYGEKWGLEDQHINQGAPLHVPVAYDMRGREGGAQLEGPHDTANIRASSGGSSKSYVIQERAVSENPDAGPDGVGVSEEPAYTLEARARPQAVAFKPSHYTRGKDGAPNDIVPPLSADADKGDQEPVVAFAQNTRDEVREMPVVGALAAQPGMKQTSYVREAMQVRRLTPIECERLQGFPEVSETVMIHVCGQDKCQQRANVATQCTTGPNNASSAAGGGSPQIADSAGQNFNTNQVAPGPRAALRVLLDYERRVVEIHSVKKLIWSASIAEQSSVSRLSIAPGSFARLVALTTQTAERTAPHGRVVSPRTVERSTHRWSGARCVALSGPEIAAHADAVATCMKGLGPHSTFTTSPSIANIPTSASTLTTLCCSVLSAIGSFIPQRIQRETSFSILIEARGGFTQVPHRNKPAADGPRYKALGNSMAVPVMRWIGRRLQIVDGIDE